MRIPITPQVSDLSPPSGNYIEHLFFTPFQVQNGHFISAATHIYGQKVKNIHFFPVLQKQ